MTVMDNKAARLANAFRDGCAFIAEYEQERHLALRNALCSHDDVDQFISAIKAEVAIISQDIDRLFPSLDKVGPTFDLDIDTLIENSDILFPISDLSVKSLPTIIARLQYLDSWFEAIFNPDINITKSHSIFRDLFSVDGFIRLSDNAILLPRRLPYWRNDLDEEDHVGILAQYLRYLAYMPGQLRCNHPDMLGGNESLLGADYVIWDGAIRSLLPVPVDPIIAVAPMAERGSDVEFLADDSRKTYALSLGYGDERFSIALQNALKAGAHILIVPEMALPEGDVDSFDDRMRDLIFSAQDEYLSFTNSLPSLRLVIAGVLGPKRGDGFHRNYAVVFDSNGDRHPSFEQRKLSHWNLTSYEQVMFGIDRHHPQQWPLANPIFENSLPGDRLTVLEIPGIGRTATLICADMSQNNPGDWMYINAVLDWLNAPIMDKSICWATADARGERRSWIVRRSYRAARLARTMVITTNSMSLTRWVNETNKLSGNYPSFSTVGIGLAIDGRENPPTFDHILVDVNRQGVVECFTSTPEHWPLFPASPAFPTS